MPNLDDLRADMNANPSWYTTWGGVLAGGGVLVGGGMLLKGATAAALLTNPVGWLAIGAMAVGATGYFLGGLKGGKFDPDELRISQDSPEKQTTQVARAPEKAVEPQRVAEATPSVEVPQTPKVASIDGPARGV